MKTLLSIVMFLTLSLGTLAHTSFTEENNLWIPEDDKAKNSDVTQTVFNKICDSVLAIYKPIVAAKKKVLIIEKKWSDGTVNAYAQQEGDKWMVTMFGGLARHQLVTPDGFALVLCHEMGHHLGGIPKYGDADWASNEGQSDYWSTMKCFRKLVAKDDNVAIMSKRLVDPYVKANCEKIHTKSPKNVAVCERSSMGGLSLASLLSSLGGEPEVKFDTPDPSVVDQTRDEHPAAQCRLDTYFASALCNKLATDDVSNTDVNKGVCSVGGYLKGARPRCWYKPAKRL